MTEGIINHVVQNVALYVGDLLLPTMCVVFVASITFRSLIYYTVKREDWFAREFEKRLVKFIDREAHNTSQSFFITAKRLLEKTYYELFEVRGIMKRRRLDYVTGPGDRLFLIQHGSAWVVRDTLKHTKFLRYKGDVPKFLEISKSVFQNNPCFSRVFGVLPIGPANDVLSILPGLFIIGGIFGTFLGIMKALPQLGGMDLANPDSTKAVMDAFLLRVSFSMSSSVVGISLSVANTVFNSVISPEKLFVSVVNRFERCLAHLWDRCDNNTLPEQIPHFDEHKDPIEALAEFSVKKELATSTSESGREDSSKSDGDKPGAPKAA